MDSGRCLHGALSMNFWMQRGRCAVFAVICGNGLVLGDIVREECGKRSTLVVSGSDGFAGVICFNKEGDWGLWAPNVWRPRWEKPAGMLSVDCQTAPVTQVEAPSIRGAKSGKSKTQRDRAGPRDALVPLSGVESGSVGRAHVGRGALPRYSDAESNVSCLGALALMIIGTLLSAALLYYVLIGQHAR
jgi:hypothetical protein